MNIHHLELFYYVAKQGGISEAVRHIPYGIQQPAVSGQVIQLEEFLGISLFHRRPFSLTPAGEELFQFIRPFFDHLKSVTAKLQGGRRLYIRIAAAEAVMRGHMPEVLQCIRQRFPSLRFSLREGGQTQVVQWLEHQEIDLGLSPLDDRLPSNLNRLVLLALPLILLVPKSSRLKSADELWRSDRLEEPLITLPADEVACRNFQQGLAAKGIDWFPGIEVNSLHLIEIYVAQGFGYGLSVALPQVRSARSVRALPLTGFSPVQFGALWRGKTTPLIQAFLEAFQNRAQRIAGNAQPSPVHGLP